jgi:uncharacterized low-complexity protein
MKALVTALALVFATSVFAAEPAKKEPTPSSAVVQEKQNDNCVKKDKNGKCPPLPKGEKPKPKKKAEDKK